MRILVLEDNLERHQVFRQRFPDCLLVSTYADAVAALAGPPFDEVWLDFDIEFGHNGADVAFFLAQQPRDRWPARVIVHSSNLAGSVAIYTTLKRAGLAVERRPFPPA